MTYAPDLPPQQPEPRDGSALLVLAARAALSLLQIVLGVLTGTLALIADATDGLSGVARRALGLGAARGNPSNRMTGLAILGGQILTVLLALWLARRGISRLVDPGNPSGLLLMLLALLSLAGKGTIEAMRFGLPTQRGDLMALVRHNAPGMAISLVVLGTGFAMLLLGWPILDSLAALCIAGYMIWRVFGDIGGAFRRTLSAAPEDEDLDTVTATLCALDGIEAVQGLSLWHDTGTPNCAATLILTAHGWEHATEIKARAELLLAEGFEIPQSQLEITPAQLAIGLN